MKASQKYFNKIREKGLKLAFKDAILKISMDPFVGKLKTGDLVGTYGYDVYCNKTNYEIAYKIIEDEDKIVIIILAGTRENFYNELKRYLN
jgi:hypothetical protein